MRILVSRFILRAYAHWPFLSERSMVLRKHYSSGLRVTQNEMSA